MSATVLSLGAMAGCVICFTFCDAVTKAITPVGYQTLQHQS
jgi:hypothetical protein